MSFIVNFLCVEIQFIEMRPSTKSMAEQMVMSEDGKDGLRVAAIRPAAIYGENETRHFHRILETMNKGKVLAR